MLGGLRSCESWFFSFLDFFFCFWIPRIFSLEYRGIDINDGEGREKIRKGKKKKGFREMR